LLYLPEQWNVGHGADLSVQIYKNSHPLSITFTVSKYPSKILGQFIKKLGLEKRVGAKRVVQKTPGAQKQRL